MIETCVFRETSCCLSRHKDYKVIVIPDSVQQLFQFFPLVLNSYQFTLLLSSHPFRHNLSRYVLGGANSRPRKCTEPPGVGASGTNFRQWGRLIE